MRRNAWAGVIAVAMALFVLPLPTAARTWSVLPDSTGDAPTIQAGIDSAATGDTVLVGCGTYLAHDIAMKSGICLRGESSDSACAVIDANEQGRVMICDSLVGETRIEGLTFAWGVNPTSGEDRNGAGLTIHHSSPLVTGCVFDNNFTSWVDGGGLYCTGGSTPVVSNCLFTNNTAGNAGGGMFAADSSCAVVRNCTFEGNFASWWGGGLACGWYSDITVDSCLFLVNTTNHCAAAFAATNRSLPTVTCCIFRENQAVSQAGAVAGYKNSIPVLENCTFYDNSAPAASVVIARDTSRIYLDKCILNSNQGGQAADAWGYGSGIFFGCSDIFGNPGGDWVGDIAGQDTINGNLSVNPGFCGAGQGDFTLASNSPCLTAPCGPMGALGEGCAEAPPDLWYVKPDGTGTVPTILDALTAADHADTIVLADGVFAGPGNRDLDCGGKNLTVYSESGDPEACIIDLGGSESEPHAGFNFDSEYHRVGSLHGITIKNGYNVGPYPEGASGALYVSGYDFHVSDCRFEANRASTGGGVYAIPRDFVMTGCRFRNNAADDGSALELFRGSSLDIEDCEFVGNVTTAYGQAVEIVGTGGLFAGCRVDSNAGSGLLVVAAGETPDFVECTFRGNSTPWDGGGIQLDFDIGQSGICVFRKCLIEGNSANAGGGINARIIYYDDVNTGDLGLSLDSCTIVGNAASSGAGIELISDYARWRMRNTIVAFNGEGEGVSISSWPEEYDCPTVNCTDIYGNEGGDWTGCLAGHLGTDGNIGADPLFCDPAAADFTLDAASPCLADPACGTIGAYGEGCDVVTGVGSAAPGVPTRLFLSQNTPNPFNPQTTIRFGLPNATDVKLTIHDATGRRVATLADGPHRAGEFEKVWDGRDSRGRPAGSGIYFFRLRAGDFTAVRKTILLR